MREADSPGERASRALAAVRAAVRQRQAALAAAAERDADLPASLARARALATLREPVPTSHRPVFGPVLVLGKKAVFQLFMKWYLRPVLEQQSAFNRAAALALEELLARQRAAAGGGTEGSTPGGEPGRGVAGAGSAADEADAAPPERA